MYFVCDMKRHVTDEIHVSIPFFDVPLLYPSCEIVQQINYFISGCYERLQASSNARPKNNAEIGQVKAVRIHFF